MELVTLPTVLKVKKEHYCTLVNYSDIWDLLILKLEKTNMEISLKPFTHFTNPVPSSFL